MPARDRKLTMEELARVDAAGYSPRSKLVVVLDDVRSRHNVGSIFRTCDSFGVAAIMLCGFTPCPPHREIEKTALGATASVPWTHHASIADALAVLKARGHTILAVEQTRGALPIADHTIGPDWPIALIFGNELNGVSDEAIEMCDGAIIIPQFGTKHSLNVSVCAGIAIWWFAGRDH